VDFFSKPYLQVQLLSPWTEKEDLGQTLREINQPPNKWTVYEQTAILNLGFHDIKSLITRALYNS
jgi:hypothetical protein